MMMMMMMMMARQMTEQTFKQIELRLNDIVHLEESLRELHTLMNTTAAHVNVHVRTLQYTA